MSSHEKRKWVLIPQCSQMWTGGLGGDWGRERGGGGDVSINTNKHSCPFPCFVFSTYSRRTCTFPCTHKVYIFFSTPFLCTRGVHSVQSTVYLLMLLPLLSHPYRPLWMKLLLLPPWCLFPTLMEWLTVLFGTDLLSIRYTTCVKRKYINRTFSTIYMYTHHV